MLGLAELWVQESIGQPPDGFVLQMCSSGPLRVGGNANDGEGGAMGADAVQEGSPRLGPDASTAGADDGQMSFAFPDTIPRSHP